VAGAERSLGATILSFVPQAHGLISNLDAVTGCSSADRLLLKASLFHFLFDWLPGR